MEVLGVSLEGGPEQAQAGVWTEDTGMWALESAEPGSAFPWGGT